MPSQPPLPHLLVPYVSFVPPSSLTVLSSVLGATGNWLVLRFLYAALSAPSNIDVGFGPNEGGTGRRKVVLVSFLRGWEFWKSEAKRLGLDLSRLTEKGRFAYVDGLSELFVTSPSIAPQNAVRPPPFGAAPSRTALPLRSPLNPAPARQKQPAFTASVATPNPVATDAGSVRRLRLSGNGLAALDMLEKDIVSIINQLKNSTVSDDEESEVLLIVDQPDLLLAATGLSKGIGATEMEEWVMGLQQNASATILTIASDSPLIHNASTFTLQSGSPLELEHATFAIGLAHRAEMVIQLRHLETGAARDVSGVLRVSKGGAWGQKDDVSDQKWVEKEVLYFVQRDGGVSIFGRGE